MKVSGFRVGTHNLEVGGSSPPPQLKTDAFGASAFLVVGAPDKSTA